MKKTPTKINFEEIDYSLIENSLNQFIEEKRFSTKNILWLINSVVFEIIVAYCLIHFSASISTALIVLCICGAPICVGIYTIVSEKFILKQYSYELSWNYSRARDVAFKDKYFVVPIKLDISFYNWLSNCVKDNNVLYTGRIYYTSKRKTETDSLLKIKTKKDIEKHIFRDVMDCFSITDYTY